jgi:hypothetical protein
MNYHDELEKQKRWFWLRILSMLTVVWARVVLVFMISVLMLMILSPPVVGIYLSITDPDCLNSVLHNAAIDVEGASVLRVVNGRGDLSVLGRPGLTSVHVEGQVCAERGSAFHAESVVLNTGHSGEGIVVSVFMPRTGSRIGNGIEMNLEIFVPEGFSGVVVDNEEGSAYVSGIGELRANVGYGSIGASDIEGGVIVESLEGSMTLNGVTGDVAAGVIRGYGEVSLSGISGNVAIEDNRNGPTIISNIGGDVTVGSSGYGRLTVRNVAGNLSVADNPGGDISVEEVEGFVQVPETPEAVEDPGA